ncbi:MAG: hypothetical protein ACRBCK_05010 [Alphaproteobacteria bacterium]
MSDTGSIQSATPSSGQSANNANGSNPLSILELPESSLPSQGTETTIRGKIVREDKDGTFHIRTDQGTVKAKPERNTNLREGDTVEIRIERRADNTQRTDIRAAPRDPSPTPNTQSTTHTTQKTPPNLDLPPTLTRVELQVSAPIKVAPLPANILPAVVQPYIETLAATVTFTSTDVALPPLLTSQNVTISDLLPLTQSNAPPQAQPAITLQLGTSFYSEAIDTPLPVTNLQVPQISTPLSNTPPIDNNITVSQGGIDLAPTPINRITEISIDNLHVPLVQLQTIDTEGAISAPIEIRVTPHSFTTENTDIAQPRAGETHALLIGLTPDKHFPILKITSDGLEQHYILQSPIESLPAGTHIEIQATQNIALPPVTSPLIAPLPITQSHFLIPDIWQTIQDVQQALAQTNPQTAQAFSNIVPNAGSPSSMGPAALFFLTAIRSGDLQGWMGDKAVDALKRAGKTDLLNRLGREFSALSRFSNEPMPQDWRGVSIPLAWQNDIHKIAIHYRKEDNKSDDETQNSGTKTRFIMDLSLSQMGGIQLDGLYQGHEDGHIGRLDLILRSEESFSAAMRQQMRTSYKHALDETSITGELSFQNKEEQWVKISSDHVKPEFSQNI